MLTLLTKKECAHHIGTPLNVKGVDALLSIILSFKEELIKGKLYVSEFSNKEFYNEPGCFTIRLDRTTRTKNSTDFTLITKKMSPYHIGTPLNVKGIDALLSIILSFTEDLIKGKLHVSEFGHDEFYNEPECITIRLDRTIY